MPTLLIKGATVLPFTSQGNGTVDLNPQVMDVLVENDKITHCGSLDEITADETIDASHQLLMPGFVDAHTHNFMVMNKGCHEALPLELWMLYLAPAEALSPRLHYLCAAMSAIESVKAGCTMRQDDLYIVNPSVEIFDAVAQAYLDVGSKVNLSFHAYNQYLHQTIPFLSDFLPESIKSELESGSLLSVDDWESMFKSIFQKWHGKEDLIHLMLAPSGSQRVTPEMMNRIGSLSETYNLPIHTHLVESRIQAVTGPELFGESVVSYAKRHGILTHRTTVAHGVWLSPEDIQLIAEVGATVSHNIVSNHRLCCGVAPIRELMDAGVNIALGSDGADTFNMFDVLKATGLIHSVLHPKFDRYPKAADVLSWAVRGGAKATLKDQEIGAIAPGMKADFVLYDLNSITFTPLNQLPIHLVYSEHGQSIKKVFINGKKVVEDGTLLTLNEQDILAEIRDHMAGYQVSRQEWYQQAEAIMPAMDQAFRKAMAYPLPFNRFTKPEKEWPAFAN